MSRIGRKPITIPKTVEVEIGTRVPADVEIGMSAAGRREDLFTQRAALYTPLIAPPASRRAAAFCRSSFACSSRAAASRSPATDSW